MSEFVRAFEVGLVTKQVPLGDATAVLEWERSDPYAVKVTTPGFEQKAIDREMFFLGGKNPFVKVFFTDVLYILFFSDSHAIVFKRAEVEEFANEINTAMPLGTEHDSIDWVAEFEKILPKE